MTEQPKKTVAIVGFAPSWQQAPFTNKSVDIWSLNEAHLMMPRVDRYFQMHPRWCWEKNLRDASYMEWIKALQEPVYMLEAYNDIPAAIRYPLAEVVADIGVEYLTSTFSYMIALAIHEKYDEIQVYGVDLSTDEEYGYQRAGAEFLFGLASGRGINVVLLPTCPLLKSGLYGMYEPDDAQLVFTQELLERRMTELNQQRVEHLAHLNAVEGAIQEITQWLGRVKFDQRERWTRMGGPPIGHALPPGPTGMQVAVPSDGTAPPQMQIEALELVG